MTAGLVLSILTLGLMGVWTAASGAANDAVIREKAIWTLNGQMERLAALYRFTEFGATGVETSTGYGYPATFSDDRLIYGANASLSMAPPGVLDAATKALLGNANRVVEAPADFATAEGYPIAYFGSLLDTDARRNYVWVDRDRSLVGRLSWEATPLVSNTCNADNEPGKGSQPCLCFAYDGGNGGDFCQEIMLSLEFPFRWDAGTDSAVDFRGETEVLTLRTIVGRQL